MAETNKKTNYVKFRELLRAGIGTRTQKDFAAEVGLSKEYLNKMLNATEISRPSRGTLTSLAAHMTHITLSELLTSCGYEVVPVEERVKNLESLLEEGLRNVTEAGKPWKDFGDLFDLIDSLFMEETCRFHIIKQEELVEQKENGEQYAAVEALWGDSEYRFTTGFLLYYCETTKGRIIPAGFTMDPEDLNQHPAFLNKFMWRHFWQHGGTGCTIVEQCGRGQKSIEERLLDAIFGSGESYVSVEQGVGFYFRQTPARVSDFLIAHQKTFCKNKETAQMFRRIVLDRDEPDEVLAAYHDPTADMDGAGAAIAAILREETGANFWYLEKEPSLPDSPDDSCIMAEVSTKEEWNRLLTPVYQAAKLLQIPEFGLCYHQCRRMKEANKTYKTDEFYLEFK